MVIPGRYDQPGYKNRKRNKINRNPNPNRITALIMVAQEDR